MEKLLAINLKETELEGIYRICSQLKIMLIPVKNDQMLTPLEMLLGNEAYRPGKTPAITTFAPVTPNANVDFAIEEKSLLIMCDLSEKHVDKLLAALRLCQTKVHHKAVLTPINRKWNAMRMLAEMDLERRTYEKK